MVSAKVFGVEVPNTTTHKPKKKKKKKKKRGPTLRQTARQARPSRRRDEGRAMTLAQTRHRAPLRTVFPARSDWLPPLGRHVRQRAGLHRRLMGRQRVSQTSCAAPSPAMAAMGPPLCPACPYFVAVRFFGLRFFFLNYSCWGDIVLPGCLRMHRRCRLHFAFNSAHRPANEATQAQRDKTPLNNAIKRTLYSGDTKKAIKSTLPPHTHTHTRCYTQSTAAYSSLTKAASAFWRVMRSTSQYGRCGVRYGIATAGKAGRIIFRSLL